jgi:hypothetical protein
VERIRVPRPPAITTAATPALIAPVLSRPPGSHAYSARSRERLFALAPGLLQLAPRSYIFAGIGGLLGLVAFGRLGAPQHKRYRSDRDVFVPISPQYPRLPLGYEKATI